MPRKPQRRQRESGGTPRSDDQRGNNSNGNHRSASSSSSNTKLQQRSGGNNNSASAIPQATYAVSPVLSPRHPDFDARDVQHSEFERFKLEQQQRQQQSQPSSSGGMSALFLNSSSSAASPTLNTSGAAISDNNNNGGGTKNKNNKSKAARDDPSRSVVTALFRGTKAERKEFLASMSKAAKRRFLNQERRQNMLMEKQSRKAVQRFEAAQSYRRNRRKNADSSSSDMSSDEDASDSGDDDDDGAAVQMQTGGNADIDLYNSNRKSAQQKHQHQQQQQPQPFQWERDVVRTADDSSNSNAAFFPDVNTSDEDDSRSGGATAAAATSAASKRPTTYIGGKSSSAGSGGGIATSTCHFEELVLQLTPTPAECAKRYSAFCDIRDLLKRTVGLSCYIFGSQRTGIALPNSDVDVVARVRALPELSKKGGGAYDIRTALMMEDDDDVNGGDDDDDDDEDGGANRRRRNNNNKGGSGGKNRNGIVTSTFRQSRGGGAPDQLFLALHQLRREKSLFYDVSPIIHARVPIIKVKHRRTGVDIDVCFIDDGLVSSDYLSRNFDLWATQRNTPARALVVLLKSFVQALDCSDPAQQGVGSFVCSLLVLWFLNRRWQRQRSPKIGDSSSSSSSGGLTSTRGRLGGDLSRAAVEEGQKFSSSTPSSVSDADDDGEDENDLQIGHLRTSKQRQLQQEQSELSAIFENLKTGHPAPFGGAAAGSGGGAGADAAMSGLKRAEDGDDDDVFDAHPSLEQLWLEMLRFYALRFDCHHLGVDCETWTAIQKPYGTDLVLMNPLDKTRNAASAAGNFVKVVVPAMQRFLDVAEQHRAASKSSNNRNGNGNASLAQLVVHPSEYILSGVQQQQQQGKQRPANNRRWFTMYDATKNRPNVLGRWANSDQLRQALPRNPAQDADGFFTALTL